MLAEEIVSTALLLLGVVLGPAIFLCTVVGYGVSRVRSRLAEYREQRYLRSLPCGACRYFANNEFLPCAINPLCVLTNEAHHCNDFTPDSCTNPANDYRSYLRTLLSPKLKLKSPRKLLKNDRSIT